MPNVTVTVPAPSRFGSSHADVVVENGIDYSQDLASSAFTGAQDILDELVDIDKQVTEIPQISALLGNVTATVSGFVKPVSPVEPEITTKFPIAPADAVLKDVDEFTIDDVPLFTTEEPDIREITPVTRFDKSAPVIGDLPNRTNAIPDKPNTDLPTKKPLRAITLPTPPNTIIVDFKGAIPGELDPAPDANFTYNEDAYSSTLLSTLNTALLNQVNHIASTGLNSDIEDQIWNRGRERTTEVMLGQIIQVKRAVSASGWPQPIGAEIEAISKAGQNADDADITESRNIAIAQAELELKNFQFAFSQAIVLEGQLINHNDQVANRALDAAKYAIQAAIDLYSLKVAYFNANIELYKAQAQVYRDKIQAELIKLEVYKTELEGQKLISELNSQDIANYRAQIDAVLAVYELYKSELESVKILLEQDALTLQQFESRIKGFAEEIKAKSLEYEGYKSELSGENIKVQMHDTLANAFGKKIDGFRSVVDARKTKQDADIMVRQTIPLEQLKVRAGVYKSGVDGESKRVDSLNNIYKTRADVFDIKTKGETARVDGEVKVQEQEISWLEIQANVEIESLKGNISAMLAKLELLAGSKEAIARIQSQLAASFGSSVNYSAGISNNRSQSWANNVTASQSASVGETWTHSDKE